MLHCVAVEGRTVVRSARAQSPLRLLLPKNHGHAQWAFVATLGGGLVDGDAIDLRVLDVAGGDKVPRKGGPGITQSDLLVINKTDLAPHVGASLEVMDRDAKKMRGDGPIVFAQCTKGVGVDAIARAIVTAWRSVAT